MTDTEKWKARARELLPKARFDNEVRLGYTGEDDQTIISIKVCSLRAAIAAALAEAYEAGRNSRAWPPKGEAGPPVDAATSWNLHYD